MSDFEARYAQLNHAQKQAVDTIDGPLMVVAGPGTGKTELLSMRVANILKTTDTLPQNILCLTFTESGASAMRERLAGLIGADAYRVAIHTFHSFGSEIINTYGEYFYNGAHFRPADELSSYEVLKAIFEKLPHDNPLSVTMNDEFTYLRDTQRAISDLKKSGLTSDELLKILDKNDTFTDWLQPKLGGAFGDRLSKKSFPGVRSLLDEIGQYEEEAYDLITYEPLHTLVSRSLEQALADAQLENSTKPLGAWKREWCEKRDDGELTLKDVKRSKRLRSVARIYYEYLLAMQKRSLYDFDDMILRVVHALEVFVELRLNLQEQYQYVLVDEFQDTNDAQMRLMWNLTNNPASEGRPNVMVVGDDDQAIYRFQGANLSNILDFRELYRDVAIVTLRDNYRSSAKILETARQTITQASERLESTIDEVDKQLAPHFQAPDSTVSFTNYPGEAAEYAQLAKRVAEDSKKHPEKSRAIIARHHRQLLALLPYLNAQGVSLSYDRRDNVLDAPPVQFLELLARVVLLLSEQELDEVNGLLPELLAHPAWGLSQHDLWQLSLSSYGSRQFWLETMLTGKDTLADIAGWLIYSAHLSLHEPLEYILDHLSGTSEQQVAHAGSDEPAEADKATKEEFRSPLRDYFFSHSSLEKTPATYVAYLNALSTIRLRVRDYHPEGQLKLSDFVGFIDKYRNLGLSLTGSSHIASDLAPVELLSAHRSKGLEFDDVYVVSLSDNIWGETARSRSKLIGYPHNLPIGISGDSSDEHIRLLFVALTRARTNLFLSAHTEEPTGKPLLPVAYLAHMDVQKSKREAPSIETERLAWHAPVTAMNGGDASLGDLLRSTLKDYKLSATHLGNFLDVTRGGPELFLLQNLLRFPQAMSPSAAYGSSVHGALQRAHSHLTATGKKRPVEDVLGDFETLLNDHQLSLDDHEFFLKRGGDALSGFLAARYDSFSPAQRVEKSFGSEHVMLGDVRLSGAIDLLDIDETAKTITVTDYKTGKSAASWQGKAEYERVKLHHYRQQLMFYKLLVEHSRSYSGFTVEKGVVEFVEPDSQGAIRRLELEYNADELAEFTRLITAVWQRIQALDFSVPSDYPSTLKGIEAFEADLLADS